MKITIQQTLHGYSEGHRLLAASCELSPESQRLMLSLSDLSGSSAHPGFDTYVTAYGIPDSGYFAFARTWIAPEMQRPGCVWTHTLLLEEQQVAGLSDIGALQRYFVRPRRDAGFEFYYGVLGVDDDTIGAPTVLDSNMAKVLVSALYDKPQRTVLIPSQSSAHYEGLVTQVWNQQWPALRAHTKFCSGVLGSLSKKPPTGWFDIAVVPRATLMHVRDSSAYVVADSDAKAALSAPWVDVIVDDLLGPSQLREFIGDWAAGVPAERAGFRLLAQLYALLGSSDSIKEQLRAVISAIAECYPNADAAGGVKNAALGGTLGGLRARMTAPDFLIGIASCQTDQAFGDATPIEHEARALAERSSRDGVRVARAIVEGDVTRLGSCILRGLAGGIIGSTITEYMQEAPDLFPLLVRHAPTIAKSREVWSGDYAGQWDIVRDVFSPNITEDVGVDVVCAMLDAGNGSVAPEVATRGGRVAVRGVLRWLDMHSRDVLPHQWRMAMARDPDDIIAELHETEHAPETVQTATTLIEPRHLSAQAAVPLWLEYAGTKADRLDPPRRRDFMAFAFATGILSSHPSSAALVALAFPALHEAAREGDLGYGAWNVLADLAPPTKWWREWDKCERLRAAFGQALVTKSALVSLLFDAVKESRTLVEILWLMRDTFGGLQYLDAAARQVQAGALLVSADQRSALARVSSVRL